MNYGKYVKNLVHVCVTLALFGAGAAVIGTAWLLYSSWGLPSVDSLRAYAPLDETIVPGTDCLGPVLALPSSEMRNLYPLLDATSEHVPEQIARTMLCDRKQSNMLRQIDEIRLTVQIRWRFTPVEQKTILLNRAYFGQGNFGTAQAAGRYFKAAAQQLSTADCALLIGLLSSPEYYSPYRHPDRALARRNTVIERARTRGTLSQEAASTSQAAPLGLK